MVGIIDGVCIIIVFLSYARGIKKLNPFVLGRHFVESSLSSFVACLLAVRRGGGSKTPKGGKFLQRQLSLRSFQQTVKNHANTINKASNVK